MEKIKISGSDNVTPNERVGAFTYPGGLRVRRVKSQGRTGGKIVTGQKSVQGAVRGQHVDKNV